MLLLQLLCGYAADGHLHVVILSLHLSLPFLSSLSPLPPSPPSPPSLSPLPPLPPLLPPLHPFLSTCNDHSKYSVTLRRWVQCIPKAKNKLGICTHEQCLLRVKGPTGLVKMPECLEKSHCVHRVLGKYLNTNNMLFYRDKDLLWVLVTLFLEHQMPKVPSIALEDSSKESSVWVSPSSCLSLQKPSMCGTPRDSTLSCNEVRIVACLLCSVDQVLCSVLSLKRHCYV